MSDLKVRIERLPAMRVGRISVRSENPEQESMEKIVAWAEAEGIRPGYRLFGYDNCQPHPNHSYTTWITVEPDVKGRSGIDIIHFPGGRFAVTRVTGTETIASTWQALVAWARENHFRLGNQPGLEEVLTPAAFDLYLSLAE